MQPYRGRLAPLTERTNYHHACRSLRVGTGMPSEE